jgi:hypothetical protein
MMTLLYLDGLFNLRVQPTLEGAPSKLCLGGDFDVHLSQTRSYLRK